MYRFGTSYFGCRFPEHVRKDMHGLREAGCSSVLHTFSEDDYFFYRGTMKEIVSCSHDEGLRVYVNPWAVAGVFGGEAFSRFLLQNYDAWQECSDGKKYPAACLNQPKLRQFLFDWIDAAAETGADVVMWDELHWFLPFLFLAQNPENVWGCCCPVCRAEFASEFGYPMPREQTPDVLRFKYQRMRRLLFELADFAASRGLQNCICFLCNVDDFPDDFSQWEEFARHKSIDIVGTDPYWELGRPLRRSPEELIRFYAQRVAEIAAKYQKEPQLWLQLYLLKGNYELVQKGVEITASCGIENIMTWCYKGAANMSALRCASPEEAWASYLKAVRRFTAPAEASR